MSRSLLFFLSFIAPLLAVSLAVLGWLTQSDIWLGWLLILIGAAYVVGGPLYLWKKKSQVRMVREERGDRSFWLLLPGFIVVIYGAPLEYLFLPPVLPRQNGMEAFGLFLILLSAALHGWARQTIGNQFDGHVQIQIGHKLIKSGPYRFVRHPAYLGYLLLNLGIATGYSSLVSFAAVFLLLLPGLVYRMWVEEKFLLGEFGEQYLEYAARTKRFIPGIW